ncbi:MAG: hypothetical protein ABIQ16_23055 [Polyangiaceae bacterium]
MHAAHGWLQEALARFDRPRLVLVFDGRRGRLRNDPEFENAMKQVLPALTQGWREFISINNTPVIKMQFLRWSHEGNSAPIRVFNDEGEALNFALEASLSPE